MNLYRLISWLFITFYILCVEIKLILILLATATAIKNEATYQSLSTFCTILDDAECFDYWYLLSSRSLCSQSWYWIQSVTRLWVSYDHCLICKVKYADLDLKNIFNLLFQQNSNWCCKNWEQWALQAYYASYLSNRYHLCATETV